MFGSTFESIFEGTSIIGGDLDDRALLESVEAEAEEELKKEKEVAIAVADADEKDVDELEERTIDLEESWFKLQTATTMMECELAMRAANLKFKNVTEGVDISEAKAELLSISEASAGEIMDKVKEFFKKMWAKVKAFLSRMESYFFQFFKSGKSFVSKYEKAIKGADLTDFEIEEYPILGWGDKALEVTSIVSGIGDKDVESLAKESNKFSVSKGAKDDAADTTIKDALKKYKLEILKTVGYTGSDPEDANVKELIREKVTGSDTLEKDTVSYKSSGEISKLLDIVKDDKKVINSLKKMKTSADSVYGKAVKHVEKLKKDTEGVALKSRNAQIEYLKFQSSTYNKAMDEVISLTKRSQKSARSILGAMYRYDSKGKGKAANESTSLLGKYLV